MRNAKESRTIDTVPASRRISAWALLRIWTSIGLQSFGGGASTQLLIRRVFVDQRGLVGADELLQLWNLCLFAPGINLIALTALIGRKLGGPWGIAASLAGMLVPSAAMTCLLAAGFAAVQQSPAVHAILRGIVPSTAGIMAVVGLKFAEPAIARVRADGPRALTVGITLLAMTALALIVFKLPVSVVLVCIALLGVLLLTPRRIPPRAAPGLTREEQSA